MALFSSDITWGKSINLKNFTLMSIANYQEKCGKVTNEKAYQYFLEQYVHDIWISEKRGESQYIKAKCFASQKRCTCVYWYQNDYPRLPIFAIHVTSWFSMWTANEIAIDKLIISNFVLSHESLKLAHKYTFYGEMMCLAIMGRWQ